MNEDLKGCYTIKELQTILGISRASAYKLLDQQQFSWVKIGRVYRIPKSSFHTWLASQHIC